MTLSDKRILVDEHFAHYPEEDVKEFFKNVRKKRKELFKKWVKAGIDEKTLFVILNTLDDVEEDLAGKKLTASCSGGSNA